MHTPTRINNQTPAVHSANILWPNAKLQKNHGRIYVAYEDCDLHKYDVHIYYSHGHRPLFNNLNVPSPIYKYISTHVLTPIDIQLERGRTWLDDQSQPSHRKSSAYCDIIRRVLWSSSSYIARPLIRENFEIFDTKLDWRLAILYPLRHRHRPPVTRI